MSLCSICCDVLLIRVLVPCSHNTVCGVCIARMRFLSQNLMCSFCKQTWPEVLFYAGKQLQGKLLQDLNMEKSKFVFDRHFAGWFETKELAAWFKKLRSMFCTVCDEYSRDKLHREMNSFVNSEEPKDSKKTVLYTNSKLLGSHLEAHHNLYLCEICNSHRDAFIIDLRLFTKMDLDAHIVKGSIAFADFPPTPRMSLLILIFLIAAHPECEMCSIRFFGADELQKHKNNDHFQCFLCQKKGIVQYYKSYAVMERHYRKDHFLCPDMDCLAKKFIVFDTEVGLQAHNYSMHVDTSKMSQADRRAASRLQININYGASQQQYSRPGFQSSVGVVIPNVSQPTVSTPDRSDEIDFPGLGGVKPAITSSNKYAFEPFDVELRPKKSVKSLPVVNVATSSVARDAIYIPLPEICPGPLKIERNQLLIENIMAGVNNDEVKYTEFRRQSALFRAGTISSYEYYMEFMHLFQNGDEAESIFIQLLALLPDELKRKELHSVYVADKTRKSNNSLAVDSDDVKSNKVVASKKQVKISKNIDIYDSQFLNLVSCTSSLSKELTILTDFVFLDKKELSVQNNVNLLVDYKDKLSKKIAEAASATSLLSKLEMEYLSLHGKFSTRAQLDLFSKHGLELNKLKFMLNDFSTRLASHEIELNLILENFKKMENDRENEEKSKLEITEIKQFQEDNDYKEAMRLHREFEAAAKISDSSYPSLPKQSPTLVLTTSSEPFVTSNQYSYEMVSTLPISRSDQARVHVLVAFYSISALTLLQKHGNLFRSRTSAARKNFMHGLVEKSELKDLADFGLFIGKLGFRKPTISLISSTMNKADAYFQSTSLVSLLEQAFEPMITEELNMLYDFCDILLAKYCNLSKYPSSSQKIEMKEANKMTLLSKKDDDLDIFAGKNSSKKKK